MLVIDPFQAFLPDSVNLNNRQQIRNLLQLLRMQAQQHGFAILLVTHTNKIQVRVDANASMAQASFGILPAMC